MLYYSYSIRGVVYMASQEIAPLMDRNRVPPSASSEDRHVEVRRQQPANSIVTAKPGPACGQVDTISSIADNCLDSDCDLRRRDAGSQGRGYTRAGGKPVLLDPACSRWTWAVPGRHSGAWRRVDEGSKSTNVQPLFDVPANAGFAWFSIDYRLAPEFRFPQAIEDVNSHPWKANAAGTTWTSRRFYHR